MTNAIEFKDVSFSYGKQSILSNIDLIIEKKDFMAILGPNGGGKTTLLKLMLGLLKPGKGNISILGTNPISARQKIGYLPQAGDFDKNFPVNVIEVVMMSDLKLNSIFPKYKKKTKQKALEMLDIVRIKDLADKNFGELSGGQKQRTLIARALMTDPEILLLDEPTASVDNTVEKDIYETLKNLNETKTIVMVSHDIGFVSSYVNKVTCLNVCSCTHRIDEIKGNSILDVYNGSIRSLEHECKL